MTRRTAAKETTMRRIPWIIPLVALLFAAPAGALEVLVLTTTTQVAAYGQDVEVRNQGPASIWCQRGADAAGASVGLAVGTGREIVRGGAIRSGPGSQQALFCISATAQVSGAATIVTGGLASSDAAGADPSCSTTSSDLDPYVGTSVTTVAALAGAKDFTIIPDACTYDCYGTWDPSGPSTVAPVRGFLIQAGSTLPISFGRGSALGSVRLACKGVNCHLHVQRCY